MKPKDQERLQMPTWEEIKGRVEEQGNVCTVAMEELREAYGASRLGVHVISDISRALAGVGLGHVPEDLPNYQHEQVRLYKKGTKVGEFIDTVLSPGEQNDKKLTEQFDDQQTDYAEIVRKVRDLVAD
ncbi:hypothetical protein [Salinicola halophyticus]|uniref:hypothetical protein n=1 Tax=Salinicola halophyticus TaxID=1808881 RepID=UPI003F486E6E